jgi:hypothetical protein
MPKLTKYQRAKRRIGYSTATWKKKKYAKKQFNKGTHYFKRTVVNTVDITNANEFTNLVAYGNTLATLPNSGDFVATYDEYKPIYVKNRYVFDRTDATVGTANISMPSIITVYDKNDGAALASEAEALQYATFRQRRLDKPQSIGWYPYMKPIGLQVRKTGWLSTNADGTAGAVLGIKHAVVNRGFTGTATVIGKLTIYTTWHLLCRGAK